MAYRLMLWPLQNISSVVGRALFPVFSRLQIDHGKLADTYTRASASIVLITAPLMLGFFVLREPFVQVVLGERWLHLVDILTWLVPLGLFQSIGTSVGTLYMATGRTDVMFKWGIGAGLLVIPAFWIGLQWGVVGVAASYAIASMLLFYPGLAIPFRFVGLKVSDFLLRIMPTLAAAFVMAFVVAGLAAIWPSNIGNQLFRLLVLIASGIVTYVVISLFTQRALLKDISRAVFNR
jgi:O-antigen/teichoic acid export membrane protein